MTSALRSAVLADMLTVAESGMPGYESTTWYGFLGPAGLPQEIVAKLNGAIIAAVGTKEVRDR